MAKEKTYTLASAEMTQIIEHANDLRSLHAGRDEMFEEYEEMYLMDWKEKNKDKLSHMRLTTSPDPRNAVQGAVRLMVATDPVWSVVSDEENADAIEKEIGRIWDRAGRAARTPIHYDLVTSGMLYAEMVAAITPTADLIEYLDKSKPDSEIARKYRDANKRQAERTAAITPFLIDAWNPREGYPEFGPTDISAYYRLTRSTVAKVRSTYGTCPGYESSRGTDPVNLHVFYDQVYCAVWTDGGLVYLDEHKLSTIPVVCQIVDGSNLFPNPEDQRQPLLYGLAKSGLWTSQNLMLSVIYTNALAMGTTPHYIHTAPPNVQGKTVVFDYDTDVVEMDAGEQFAPLPMSLIPADLTQAYQLSVSKGQESTIYPQALGAAADRNTSFSEVSLLAQQGRLPLIGSQRRGGWGIGAIGEKILLMMRDDPAYLAGSNLKKGDIPATIQLEAKLEVKLPQDKLQQANIARMLVQGDNPLVSNAWAQENILQIGQPKTMQKEVWDEKAAQIMYGQSLQKLIVQAQQQDAQNASQIQNQGQTAPQNTDRSSMPMSQQNARPMPSGPMMAPDQAQQIQGGLPPQQAGMMPGAGGMVPPDQKGGLPNG